MDIYKALRYISLNIPLRGMRRIVKFIADPNSDLDYEFTVPFYGKQYSGTLSDYIDWNVYFFGAYEKSLINFIYSISSNYTEGYTMLDIGANVGHHSLALSAIADNVYSFEPFPPLCEKFKERIAYNNIKNIYLNEYALGDEAGSMKFFPPSTSNQGQGSFVRSDSESNLTNAVSLEIRVADDVITNLGIKDVRLIKIDVEGFEPKVLKGLKNTLEANKPILVVEKSPENESEFSELDSFLSHLPIGYELYLLSKVGYVFIKYRLKRMNNELFNGFTGNLVCIPSNIGESTLDKLLNQKY